jgi:DHA1 family multidrug resistance protein-like MFS transporter
MFLIAVIVSTPAGIFADKVGRKPLLLFGHFVCGLTTLLIFFIKDPLLIAALWSFPLHPYIIVGSTALIADKTTVQERGLGMGLFVISQSLGRMIGPILGGILSDIYAIKETIPISAAFLFLGGIYSLFFIRESKNQ